MTIAEFFIFEITVEWTRQVRRSIFQDESEFVRAESVASKAYVIAPNEELAVSFFKDKMQWSSYDKKVNIRSIVKHPIYGTVSTTMIGAIEEI